MRIVNVSIAYPSISAGEVFRDDFHKSIVSLVISNREGEMAKDFRIQEARESDIPEIMSVLIPSFAHIPVEEVLGNVDTPEARKAAGERHLSAWHDHADGDHLTPCAIKCVHTDPTTGRETIVGFAEWFIYEQSRNAEQYRRENFLLSASWLEGAQREKAKRWLKPMVDGRVKWMGGRKCAIFMYMCVHRDWRRKGASTMCVQWGLERCKERGIPAYLEASEEGEHVYKKLGFEEVEKIRIECDDLKAAFPAMIWWPPGTKEEDKKPAIP